MVAEESLGLTRANKKSKEGVRTKNNDHINLKVVEQDDSEVPFKMDRQAHNT